MARRRNRIPKKQPQRLQRTQRTQRAARAEPDVRVRVTSEVRQQLQAKIKPMVRQVLSSKVEDDIYGDEAPAGVRGHVSGGDRAADL